MFNVIKIPDEWVVSGGKNVTVAVIDSHVTPIKDKIKKYYTVSSSGVFDSSHGCSVCDIISHVAPFCDIIVSQAIFGKKGNNDSLLMATRKIVNDNVDVVNFSLSTATDKHDMKSCVYDLSKRALIVAAMANDGSISYPAQYDFVTSVSSYKRSNIDADIYCEESFSFDGKPILKTGNSMSTAFVSGIFALAKSYNKNITREEIIKQLLGR